MTITRENFTRLKNYTAVEFDVDPEFVTAALHFAAASIVVGRLKEPITQATLDMALAELMAYSMEKSGLRLERSDAFLTFINEQFLAAMQAIKEEHTA